MPDPEFPECCETCRSFAWSGDVGLCDLLVRPGFTGTVVSPHMSCPHYKADVRPLLVELGLMRRIVAERAEAHEMTGDGMGV